MKANVNYNELIDSIFRFIYLRVNNKEIAEDLTQDCFLSAVNYARDNRVDNLRAFLYSTARNKVIDYYRQKSRMNKIFAADVLIEEIIDGKNFLSASDARLFLEKLNLLEEGDRDILIMRYVDELEIKDIAKIIGKNSVATRVRISRSLKRAKKLYENPGFPLSRE